LLKLHWKTTRRPVPTISDQIGTEGRQGLYGYNPSTFSGVQAAPLVADIDTLRLEQIKRNIHSFPWQ